MLAKKFHLRIQDQKIRQGEKLKVWKSNQYFVVKISSNNLSYSRFGIIISKSINRKAVRRNQIKRIIFDFIRLNKLYGVAGKDILIICRPVLDQLIKTKIQQELSKIFLPK